MVRDRHWTLLGDDGDIGIGVSDDIGIDDLGADIG
jgi:hypothetical protein